MYQLIASTMAFLFSISIFAGTKDHYLKYEVQKNSAELVDIYTNFESTCMNGCPYYSPSVEEIKVIVYDKTPNSFYIWVSIKDLKDSQSFFKIDIKKHKNMTQVSQRQVSKKLAKKLEARTYLANNPLFKSNNTLATFESISERKTIVEFKIEATYSILLSPVADRIQKALIEISEVMRKNLDS